MKIKSLSIATIVMFLVSCSDAVHQVTPDMNPIGDGLKVIGYALVAVAVVLGFGRAL